MWPDPRPTLTSAVKSNGSSWTYTYDVDGNRTSSKVNATATVYAAYGATDELHWTGASAGACGTPPSGATTYG